jgi:hypothetical protein
VNIWRLHYVCISLLLLLTGCAVPAPVNPPAAPPGAAQQEDIQNNLERQMVLLFQSLVQMDRRERLSISSKQAEVMLPMVMRNSDVGGLTQADQNQMIDMLSPEQKVFVNEFQERAKSKLQAMKEIKEKATTLSDEEREKMIHDFENRRRQEREADRQTGTPERIQDSGSPGAAPGSMGSGKNVEQQLIDILQARLNKTNINSVDKTIEK